VANPITISYSGTIETYTVTSSGDYEITAYGAQGGAIPGLAGGGGAEIGTDVPLTAGMQLLVVVGGEGENSDLAAGGVAAHTFFYLFPTG
jgi:hypothetical protein